MGQTGLAGDLADRPELAPHVFGFDDWLAGAPGESQGGGRQGYRKWVRVDNGAKTSFEGEHATLVQGREARRWWRSVEGPKLLFLSFNAPHAPFEPVEASPIPKPSVGRKEFLAMIEDCDVEIGALLAEVDLERTVVMLFTDNGTPPQAGGGRRGKKSTFERGVNVPCIVAGRASRRARATSPCSASSTCPATLCDLVGAPAPFEDSLSFAPALRFPDRWAATSLLGVQRVLRRLPRRRHGARGGLKLRVVDGVTEFYDLATDPDEDFPLQAGDVPAHTAARLHAILARIRRGTATPRAEAAGVSGGTGRSENPDAIRAAASIFCDPCTRLRVRS